MKKLYRKGFTLIELLVVIAIIGILAAIVLVSLNTARSKARDTRRVADVSQVQLALEMYYDSKGAYPPQGAAGAIAYASTTACPAATCLAADNLECLVACGYMPALPKDPGSTSYLYWTGSGRYILAATLENNNQTGPLGGDLNDCTNVGSTAGCSCADPIYCAGI